VSPGGDAIMAIGVDSRPPSALKEAIAQVRLGSHVNAQVLVPAAVQSAGPQGAILLRPSVISWHDVLFDSCDDVLQVPGVQESILVPDTHA